jgi:peptidoglycan/xylan/chitin deacetylase (PgdA/CDA1 family)
MVNIGVMHLAEDLARNRVTVITYHRVLPDTLLIDYLFPSLAVSESVFSAQMKYLSENCEVVLLDEGLERLAGANKITKPLVAITFDDGYMDNYVVAAPILRKFNFLATFYVVTNLINSNDFLWHDVAARTWEAATASSLQQAADNRCPLELFSLGQKPPLAKWMTYLKSLDGNLRSNVIHNLVDPGPHLTRGEFDCVMTTEQICELADRGHQIGSHTCTHPLLNQLNDESLKFELEQSKLALEKVIRKTVTSFCYPNGNHNDCIVNAVHDAGYLTACTTLETTNTGNCERLRIGRVDMNPARVLNSSGDLHIPSFRAALTSFYKYNIILQLIYRLTPKFSRTKNFA